MKVVLLALWLAFLTTAQAQAAAVLDSGPTIYVARRGWHVDIGFDKRDLREPLLSISKNFPQASTVFFGFGDLHYLADERNQHGPRMLAALWPGRGILLVTTLQIDPVSAFGESSVIALRASDAQMRDAQRYVWNSLVTTGGSAELYREGPYEGGYYFLARPKYSALHTCNTWAAQTLRAAGYPIHAQGVLFARQLWSRARRVQRDLNHSPQAQGGRVPS
jgi:hypothetical protein